MNECVSCEDTITNPLCPSCLARGIGQWMKERGLEDRVSVPLNDSVDSCIKCGDAISLCTYCFTKHVYEELKIAEVPKAILEEFTRFFHFDLERLGYFSKARKEGLSI